MLKVPSNTVHALKPEALCEKIAQWYGGYRFDKGGLPIYHLNSVLNFFSQKAFRNYWLEQGTPTYLRDLLYKSSFKLQIDEPITVDSAFFNFYESERLSQLAALYQSGYLTISDWQDGLYSLDNPNEQTRKAFEEIIKPKWLGSAQS